jgi:hypothetical protein
MSRIPQDEFDRIWAELSKEPEFYMGWPVHSFDPEQAARRRYYPLAQVIYWLEKLPKPWGCFPDMELLSLARVHIQAGRLKHYGPSTRFTPVVAPPETVEVIEGGKTVSATLHFPFQIEEIKEVEDAKNYVVDIFEFADWFRGLRFEYLRLPDNWPTTEPSQAKTPAPQPSSHPQAGPAEPFRFKVKRRRSGYADLAEKLAEILYKELGRNADAGEAWARLMSNPPPMFKVTLITVKGSQHIQIPGERCSVSKKEWKERWDRWNGE